MWTHISNTKIKLLVTEQRTFVYIIPCFWWGPCFCFLGFLCVCFSTYLHSKSLYIKDSHNLVPFIYRFEKYWLTYDCNWNFSYILQRKNFTCGPSFFLFIHNWPTLLIQGGKHCDKLRNLTCEFVFPSSIEKWPGLDTTVPTLHKLYSPSEYTCMLMEEGITVRQCQHWIFHKCYNIKE